MTRTFIGVDLSTYSKENVTASKAKTAHGFEWRLVKAS